MTEKFITYHSSIIFYRIIGKGKPVVLVHGFGEDGTIWKNQIEFLKNHFQLIVPDLPGSGQSAVGSNQLAVSVEAYAEVVSAVLLEEKIDSCIMTGHSMGGYIILAFAEKYPHLVKAFGLFHSSAFADSEEKKAARLKSIEFIKNNSAYEFLKTTITGLFLMGQDGSKPSDPNAAILIEKGKQFTPEALIHYYQAMIARPDRVEVLKTFNGPVLFIIGEHDKAVPFEQSMQQCYLPAQSHIHILRNSAHMGMWEEAEKTNIALLEFLQQAT